MYVLWCCCYRVMGVIRKCEKIGKKKDRKYGRRKEAFKDNAFEVFLGMNGTCTSWSMFS